jgi:hypothetical protein
MTSLAFTQLDIGGPVATLSLDHSGDNRINFCDRDGSNLCRGIFGLG